MLFQLGNKKYEGLFAPDSWSYSGNEANLAEYALINTKPRLQLTGQTLEEVNLSFQLRVEFCKPALEIKDLETWKDNGEVLPLLLGNGDYVNDYVIKSISKDITQTFDDGTIIEAWINLNLLEYVPTDAEAQQAANDRKNAAAVGDKSQVNSRTPQPKTSEAAAHQALMESINKSWEAANASNEALNAQSPESVIDKVKSKVKQAQDAMDNSRQKISDAQQQINNATGIIAAVNQAKDNLTEIGNLMQSPISLYNLGQSILNLQSSLSGIDTNASVFTNDVILRKL